MRILTVLVLAAMLSACGSEETADNRPAADTERAPTVGAEIARDLKDPMDRAKNVEDQVMNQKDRIDAALDDAEDDPNRD
jgi:hypothetical protein